MQKAFGAVMRELARLREEISKLKAERNAESLAGPGRLGRHVTDDSELSELLGGLSQPQKSKLSTYLRELKRDR